MDIQDMGPVAQDQVLNTGLSLQDLKVIDKQFADLKIRVAEGRYKIETRELGVDNGTRTVADITPVGHYNKGSVKSIHAVFDIASDHNISGCNLDIVTADKQFSYSNRDQADFDFHTFSAEVPLLNDIFNMAVNKLDQDAHAQQQHIEEKRAEYLQETLTL